MALSRCRQRLRPARSPLTSSRHGGAAASGFLALFSLHRLHRWLAPPRPRFHSRSLGASRFTRICKDPCAKRPERGIGARSYL